MRKAQDGEEREERRWHRRERKKGARKREEAAMTLPAMEEEIEGEKKIKKIKDRE